MPNLNAAQYDFVRKLLQCGHEYAKLDRYAQAFRLALDKWSQAGTDGEADGWLKVCIIIRELAVLTFGEEAERFLVTIMRESSSRLD